jgi:hypothetical protein
MVRITLFNNFSSIGKIKILIFSKILVAKLKNTRHMRVHASMGHGRVGKHRKHSGGRGTAGVMHHERIMMKK